MHILETLSESLVECVIGNICCHETLHDPRSRLIKLLSKAVVIMWTLQWDGLYLLCGVLKWLKAGLLDLLIGQNFHRDRIVDHLL